MEDHAVHTVLNFFPFFFFKVLLEIAVSHKAWFGVSSRTEELNFQN